MSHFPESSSVSYLTAMEQRYDGLAGEEECIKVVEFDGDAENSENAEHGAEVEGVLGNNARLASLHAKVELKLLEAPKRPTYSSFRPEELKKANKSMHKAKQMRTHREQLEFNARVALNRRAKYYRDLGYSPEEARKIAEESGRT